MQVQESGPVGEHWVDVDLLDVGDVADRVLREVQVAQVLDGAVVLGDALHLRAHLVERVLGLPLILAENNVDAQAEDGQHRVQQQVPPHDSLLLVGPTKRVARGKRVET